MKEYQKPFIEEEIIELEDVIAASNLGKGNVDTDGESIDVGKLW